MIETKYCLIQSIASGAHFQTDHSIFRPGECEKVPTLWDIQPLARIDDQTIKVQFFRVGASHYRTFTVSDVLGNHSGYECMRDKQENWEIKQVASLSAPLGYATFQIYASVQKKDRGYGETKLALQAVSKTTPLSLIEVESSTSSPSSSSSSSPYTPSPNMNWCICQVRERAYRIYNEAFGVSLAKQTRIVPFPFLSILWECSIQSDTKAVSRIRPMWPTSSNQLSVSSSKEPGAYYLQEKRPYQYPYSSVLNSFYLVEGNNTLKTSPYVIPERERLFRWKIVPLPARSDRDLDLASLPDIKPQLASLSSTLPSSSHFAIQSIITLMQESFYHRESLLFSRLEHHKLKERIERLEKLLESQSDGTLKSSSGAKRQRI